MTNNRLVINHDKTQLVIMGTIMGKTPSENKSALTQEVESFTLHQTHSSLELTYTNQWNGAIMIYIGEDL